MYQRPQFDEFDPRSPTSIQQPRHKEILELHRPDEDWKHKVPGIRAPNWNSHPLSILSSYQPNSSTPLTWSPGENKPHPMHRNPLTSAATVVGELTNLGRHNVPAGHLGVSENNGQLVLLGPGNHWMISPNHKFIHNVSIGQPAAGEPIINLRNQVMIIYVKEGDIAVVKLRGQFVRMTEGIHVIEGQNAKYERSISLSESVIELGNVQIITVMAGFIGFAFDSQGNLLKLEAGKHVLQNPDQTFTPYNAISPFVSLSERLIRKGPYLRIRVEGNEVCVISDEKGEFQLLGCGVHEYFDPNVSLKDYLPLSQRNLSIKPAEPFKTSDNADVKTSFDVYFDIAEPSTTIKSLCDPEQCKEKGDLLERISEWVQEKAIDAMAAVIVHYQATDIAVIPDVKSASEKPKNAESEDRMHSIRQEFVLRLSQSLESVGIRLDSINLSSGLQIISQEAKKRVEGLIGAGAQEQLMLAEQRAALVKADTQRQTAEIGAQIEQVKSTRQAETQQKILISNAQAQQKAAFIEAETNALRLKTKLNVLIECLGPERAFKFVQMEQHVNATKATFANATTIVTGNSSSANPHSPLLLSSHSHEGAGVL